MQPGSLGGATPGSPRGSAARVTMSVLAALDRTERLGYHLRVAVELVRLRRRWVLRGPTSLSAPLAPAHFDAHARETRDTRDGASR